MRQRLRAGQRIFFLAFLVVLLFGQARAEASGERGPRTVIDFRGRTITLTAPARRVVCLIESALSGIYMLGAGEAVVAVSSNVYQESVNRYYAAMDERIAQRTLPSPGNWDFVNMESVVILKPDLVIIWADQEETISALAEKGIAVYGVGLSSFEDVFKEIADFGILFGRRERAGELIDYARKELRGIAASLGVNEGAVKPGVYFMWAQGELETSGAPSTVNDLIELAGARNVCGHIRQEHTIVNLENILAWNPQIIVMWHNPRKSPQDILSLPVWQSLSAAKNRNVFELPSVFYCDLWTLKCLHAVKRMAVWCHPENFAGIDLEKEKRTMLQALYGMELGGKIPLAE